MKINEIITEQIVPPQIPNTLIGTGAEQAINNQIKARSSLFKQKPEDPYADLSHMQQYQRGLRSIQDVDPKQDAIQPIVPELDLLGAGGIARSIAKPLASIAKDAAGIYKASKPQPPGQLTPDWTKVEIGSNRSSSTWDDVAKGLKSDKLTPEQIASIQRERAKANLERSRKNYNDKARQEYIDAKNQAIDRAAINVTADTHFNRQATDDSK